MLNLNLGLRVQTQVPKSSLNLPALNMPVPPPPPPPLASWRVSDLRCVAKSLSVLCMNPAFQHLVGRIFSSDFSVIKSWSHLGVVYWRGYARNLGNMVYAIFWNLLVGMAPYHPIHMIGLANPKYEPYIDILKTNLLLANQAKPRASRSPCCEISWVGWWA